MIRSIYKVYTIAAVTVFWFGTTLGTPVYAKGRTDFQNSCHQIRMAGATLLATCERVDGSSNRTSIVLSGIENFNGRLEHSQPRRRSTFQNSCRQIHITGDFLSATCRLADGQYTATSINIEGLSNVDGNLQFPYR